MKIKVRGIDIAFNVLFIIFTSCCLDAGASSLDESESITSNKVVVWGHSAGTIIGPFLEQYLKEAIDINFEFEDCSRDGENMLQVAARQGSLPAYFIDDFCVSFDKGYLVATDSIPLRSSYDDSELSFAMAHGFNPCSINDVPGWLYRREEGFYFEPSNNHDLRLDSFNAIIPYASKEYRNALVTVFWCDQTVDNNTPSELVRKYEIMTQFVGNENYFIMGSIVGTDSSRTIYEQALIDRFGSHFFNGRKFLISEALKEVNNDTPFNDIVRINSGQLPSSFMKDNIHLNEKAARLISQKIVEVILSNQFVQLSLKSLKK